MTTESKSSKRQTAEEREAALEARPYLRFALAGTELAVGDEATKGTLVLTHGKAYRNRSNAREAALAWAGHLTVHGGKLVLLVASSAGDRAKQTCEEVLA